MLDTDQGPMILNILDTAGQEILGCLKDDIYRDAECAIIMFDLTSRITYAQVPEMHRDLIRERNEDTTTSIILCGNKADIRDRKVQRRQITFPDKKHIPYFDISAKVGNNIWEPIRVFAISKGRNLILPQGQAPATRAPDGESSQSSRDNNDNNSLMNLSTKTKIPS